MPRARRPEMSDNGKCPGRYARTNRARNRLTNYRFQRSVLCWETSSLAVHPCINHRKLRCRLSWFRQNNLTEMQCNMHGSRQQDGVTVPMWILDEVLPRHRGMLIDPFVILTLGV